MEKMILYTVKYKKPGWLFWRSLKDVQADGFGIELKNRYFILKDDIRVELPGTLFFRFSRERFDLIQSIQAEAAEARKGPKDKGSGPKLTIVK